MRRIVSVHLERIAEACPDLAHVNGNRMATYEAGDWHVVFIQASAAVVFADDVIQTIRSGGLGGTPSDSDYELIEEIEHEQLQALSTQLVAAGFHPVEIAKAMQHLLGGEGR